MSWFRLALRVAFIPGLIVIGTVVVYLPLLQPLHVLFSYAQKGISSLVLVLVAIMRSFLRKIVSVFDRARAKRSASSSSRKRPGLNDVCRAPSGSIPLGLRRLRWNVLRFGLVSRTGVLGFFAETLGNGDSFCYGSLDGFIILLDHCIKARDLTIDLRIAWLVKPQIFSEALCILDLVAYVGHEQYCVRSSLVLPWNEFHRTEGIELIEKMSLFKR